jgi:hypothetical protein
VAIPAFADRFALQSRIRGSFVHDPPIRSVHWSYLVHFTTGLHLFDPLFGSSSQTVGPLLFNSGF